MEHVLFNRLKEHYNNPNYFHFLISLVGLLLIPAVSPMIIDHPAPITLSYAYVILMASLYTTNSTKELVVFLCLGILVLLFYIEGKSHEYLLYINCFLNSLFFLLVLRNIILFLLKSTIINVNTLLASVCGYLILGIFSASTFFTINRYLPNTFNVQNLVEFYDFVYFAFINLTSVGFGDIHPVHPLTKGVTLLFAISGQLYLTILIALIMGKFLANQHLSQNN